MNQSLQCKLHLMTKIFSTVKTNLFKDNSPYAVAQLLRYNLNQDDGRVNMTVSFKSYKKIFPELTKEDFSQFLNVTCDSIVSSVETRASENDQNIVFYLNSKAFIEDVLLNRKVSDPGLQVKQENVVLDYSSPNVAKPFHLGHLRSTIIGHFLGNLFEHLGHNVKRINYLGDWGTQFGVLQIGIQAQYLSNADLKREPLQQLYNAYVFGNRLVKQEEEAAQEARRIFNSLELGGHLKTMERWKMIRQATVDELTKTYARLGIKFDEYHWESNYNAKVFAPLLEVMEANRLIEDSDGKKVVDLNNNLVPLLKSDGSTLYLSRDVAAALDRWVNYQFDRMLYVVDNSQNQHFSNLKKILHKLDYDWAERVEHVKFGRIQGMSTRKGNVVFLKDILDEAKNRMAERQLKSPNTKNTSEKVTDILGVSALIINDLKQRRLKDYSFNWDSALQSDGDSGVKLQYTHCRLNSLEQNCGVALPDSCDPSVLTEPEAMALLLEIARFDEAVERAYSNFEALEIVNYLFKLCNRTSQALNRLNVKNEPANVAEQRLLMFHRARNTLHCGMSLLGLQPLTQM